MADNTEKKVIVSVDIINNFVQAKKSLDQAKKSFKETENEVDKLEKKLEILKNTEEADAKAIKETTDELNRQKSILSDQAIALAKSNNEFKNAKKQLEGAAKAEEIFNVVTEKTNQSLGEMQRELSALKNTPFSGLDDKQVKEVQQRIADLTAKIQDYKTEIKGLDTGQVFANTAEGIEFISASVSGLSNTLSTLGVDSEVLGGLSDKTTELIAIVQAMGVVTEYLEKQKYKLVAANLSNIAALTAEKASAMAASVATFILGKSADTASLSFTRLKVAILSSGIGTIVIAVAALTYALYELNKASNDTIKKQNLLTHELNETADAIRNIDSETDFDIRIAEASGKSTEEIRKLRLEAVRTKIALAEMSLDKVSSFESKATKEQIEQAQKMVKDAYAAEKKFFDDSTVELVKNINKKSDIQSKAADEEYNRMMDNLSKKLSLDSVVLQSEADYQSENFSKRQAYAYKLFNLQQNSEIERLKLQLKYGKIRQDEFDRECQILLAAQRQFSNEQLKLAEQYQDDIRKNLFELLNVNVDNQILEIERQYAEAFKQLGEIKLPVFQEGMDVDLFNRDYERAEQLILERAQLEVELEKQKQEKISEIRKQSIEKQAKDIEQTIFREYEGDLAKFSDNEKEKLRIEIESQQKIIAEKKKAGLQTYEDEATLRGLQSRENQLALNMNLMQVNLNAKQRYDLIKSMLEQEQKLYEGNALKQLEISQALMENERQLLEDRAKSFEDWSTSTMDLLSGLNSFISELESAQMQEFEYNNNKKKDDLKERLDKGFITQKEYEQKVKELDKEAEKQKAEIARKSAIREKAMNAFQIGIDTAMGVMKAVAASPLTFGLPWSAFVAATGALELAAVLAKPIPKAAKGKLIVGPSHAAGGTLIEAEGGEAIINRRSVSMFAPLLSAINEAGGGVPFARPLSDGGYSIRNSSAAKNITLEDMQTAISDAVSQVQVVATIEDIRREDSNYMQIQNRASY